MIPSSESLDEELDKIQDNIEKTERRNIQKDYEKQIPAFIWILKILIILGMITAFLNGLLNFFITGTPLSPFIGGLAYIIGGLIFLIGIFFRRRWAWYYGLIFIGTEVIISTVYGFAISVIYHSLIFVLLLIHRDYLNK